MTTLLQSALGAAFSPRLAALTIAVLAGLALLGALKLYRSRTSQLPERVTPGELDLQLDGAPAFVLFSQPACRPCRSARRVLDSVLESTGVNASVTVVDVIDRSDLATSCGVRAIPTVLLVEPGGRVARRWSGVPPTEEVRAALSEA